MALSNTMMALGAALVGHAVAQVRPVEENSIQCLLFNGNGCNTINDKDACLNSRDGRFFQLYYGRQIRGEPCVWCPDGCEPKAENGGNKCEPYQWVVGNNNLPTTTNWVGANCLDGRDIKETVQRVPGYVYSAGEPEGSWVAVNGGENQACRGAHALDAGNVGSDWSYTIWSAANLEQCKAFCKGACTGVEFRAADRYCEVWWSAITASAEMSGYECHRREGVQAVPLQMPQGASGPPGMLALPQPTEGASAGIAAGAAAASAAGSGAVGAAGAAMNNAAQAATLPAVAVGDAATGIASGVSAASGSAADAATQATGSATDAATQTIGAATDAANSALEAAGEAAGAAGASVSDAASAAVGMAGAAGAAAGDAANAANEAGVNAMRAGSGNEAAANAASAASEAAAAAGRAADAANEAGVNAMNAANEATGSVADAANAGGAAAGDAANAAGAVANDAAGAAADAAGAAAAAAGDAANAANEAGVSAMNAANEATGSVANAANAAGEAAGDAANAAVAAANDAAGVSREVAGAAGEAAGDAANGAGAAVNDASVSAMNAANDVAGSAADAANAAGTAATDAANSAGVVANDVAGAATDAANSAMAGAADAINGAGTGAADTMNAAAGAVGASAAGAMAAATGVLSKSLESPPAITNAGEIAQQASDAAGTLAGEAAGAAGEAAGAAADAANQAADTAAGAFGAAADAANQAAAAAGDAAGTAADGANQAADAAGDAGGAAADAANEVAGAAANAANQATGSASDAAGAAADTANQAANAAGDAAGAAADAANEVAGVAADAANQAAGAAGDAAGVAADAAGEAAGAAAAAAEGAVTAVTKSLTGGDDVPGPEGHPDNSVAEWPAPKEAKIGDVGGRFVRGDQVSEEGQPGEIFWQDAYGKHTLPEGVNCAECGCDGQNVQTIAQAELNAMPAGDTFHCVAMNPAAPTMFPGGRFVVVEEEVPLAAADSAAAVADGSAPAADAATAAADAGAAGAEAGSVGGQAGAKQVYWQSPTGEMHPVPEGYDCSKCGCNNPMRVAGATVKAAVNGADFNCEMTGGLPVSVVPEVSVMAREAPHFASGSLNGGELDTGAEGQSQKEVADATPTDNLMRWGLITALVILLAGIVFYCHHMLAQRKKDGKVSRGVGLCPHDEGTSDEEAGGSPKSRREVRKVKNANRSDGDDGVDDSAGHSYAAASREPLIPSPAMMMSPGGLTNQAAHSYPQLSVGSGPTYMPAAVAYSPQRAVAVQVAGVRPQGPTVFDQIDRNHDGVISREEWQRYAFNAFDRDRNGVVSAQEWQLGRQRP